MADGARSGPWAPASEGDTRVRSAVALGSLALLVLGLVGLTLSSPVLSAPGLFLYAMFGFGGAILILLGYRGWRLVTFASPLGVSLLLIVGVLLSTAGIWAAGPTLFWILVVLSAYVHVATLTRAYFARNSPRAVAVRVAGPGDSRDEGVITANQLLAERDPRALVAVTATVVGLLLCLVSALSIQHLDPGWGGILGAISPAWYVGLAVLLVAIFVGLRLGGVFVALPVILLQLVLTGTPSIVFDDPRYAWTIKQVGVTSYIMLHGSANPRIDIYQAWPGLFSAVAWLCRVSDLSAPLAVARWWSPIIDLATLLVFYELAVRVLQDSRRAWIACTVFIVGYTIVDADYFSSQSTAYLLGIAIFAVVFCHRDERSPISTPGWMLLFAASIGEAITHQLSPYMVTAALIVLVVFGRSRTRWAPVITLVPALAWASAHYSYVSQHISFSELFNIFSNLSTPGISAGGPAPGTLADIVRYFQGTSALLIGLIGLAALIHGRKSLHLVLSVCAASAGLLIFANSYGNEADFRVVLFALPWLAILGGSLSFRSRFLGGVFWPVAVTVLLPVYLVADMGLDFVYAARPGDLATVRAFEETAPVGSYLVFIGLPADDPTNLTARYNVVNELSYASVLGTSNSGPQDAAVSYQQFMAQFFKTINSYPYPIIGSSPSYYVLTAQQPAAYLAAYNYATLKQYQDFAAQFATSPLWQTILQTSTSRLLRLRTWPKATAS